MADVEKIIVEAEVDLSTIDGGLKAVGKEIGELQTFISDLDGTVSTGFDIAENALGEIKTEVGHNGAIIENTTKLLMDAIKESIADVVAKLDNIVTHVSKLQATQDNGSDLSGVANILSAMDSGTNLLEKYQKQADTKGGSSEKKYTGQKQNNKTSNMGNSPFTNDKGQLLLPAAGESSYGKTKEDSASGIVSGGLMDLGVSFPDVESMDALAESVGNVASRIKESAAAWGQELAAKAASKAEDLRIIVINTVEHVKAFGMMIGQLVASAAAWAGETAAKVANTAAQWAQNAATTAWQAICTAATAVTTAFGAAVSFLTSPIGLVIIAITALIAIVVLLVKNWDTVKAAVLSAWDAIVGALGSAWEWFKTKVLDPIINGFKSAVNGVIGFINGLIAGAVDGINAVIGLLNKLQFTVPDWVPGLGGQTLGFNLKLLNAPQIPYLAKGAVLPANKPFLAVVGDQKHGTNVEAPLTTIQEAVAVVMGDQIAAMMAGFEALLKEQRATRQTIEGIEIGDTVIGRAAERYGRKMAREINKRRFEAAEVWAAVRRLQSVLCGRRQNERGKGK